MGNIRSKYKRPNPNDATIATTITSTTNNTRTNTNTNTNTNHNNTNTNNSLTGRILISYSLYSLRLIPSFHTAEVSGPLNMSVVDTSNNHYVNSFLEKYKILARYMGVASGKTRVGGEPPPLQKQIAPQHSMRMTSPVVMTYLPGSAVPHTVFRALGPVATQGGVEVLSFILPVELRREDLPLPIDPLIHIRQVPTRCVASITISGVYSYRAGRQALLTLKRLLVADGWLHDENEDVLWCAALHHYTPSSGALPADRRTDIWIVLDLENERIRALAAPGDQIPADLP